MVMAMSSRRAVHIAGVRGLSLSTGDSSFEFDFFKRSLYYFLVFFHLYRIPRAIISAARLYNS